MSIIEKYRNEIRENKPIEFNGLTFHPMTVRDFALYQNARPSFELLQSSLPWQLARLSWIDCLWEIDVQSTKNNGQPAGFLGAVFGVLGTALRLPATLVKNGNVAFPIRVLPNSEGRLQGIVIYDPTKAQPTILTAQQMGDVRAIIAAQNAYEIPDENWNPELLKAARYTEAQNSSNIKPDLDDLVYSLAVNTGCRSSEIWGWPIREFQGVQKAIDRKLNYVIYSMAATSGFVTFKNGNPCPSWRYDKKDDLPGAFQNIEVLNEGAHGLLSEATTNS